MSRECSRRDEGLNSPNRDETLCSDVQQVLPETVYEGQDNRKPTYVACRFGLQVRRHAANGIVLLVFDDTLAPMQQFRHSLKLGSVAMQGRKALDQAVSQDDDMKWTVDLKRSGFLWHFGAQSSTLDA